MVVAAAKGKESPDLIGREKGQGKDFVPQGGRSTGLRKASFSFICASSFSIITKAREKESRRYGGGAVYIVPVHT